MSDGSRKSLLDSNAEDQDPDELYHSNRGFTDEPCDEVRFGSVSLQDFPLSLVPAGESGPELTTTSEQIDQQPRNNAQLCIQECRVQNVAKEMEIALPLIKYMLRSIGAAACVFNESVVGQTAAAESVDNVKSALEGVRDTAKVAEFTVSLSCHCSRSAVQSQERHVAAYEAANLTKLATKDLVRVFEAIEEVTKTIADAATSGPSKLASSVLECCVRIATKAHELAEFVTGLKTVDEFAGRINEIDRSRGELERELRTQWTAMRTEAAGVAAAATQETAKNAAELAKSVDVNQIAKQTLQGKTRTAADTAKLLAVIAKQELVQLKAAADEAQAADKAAALADAANAVAEASAEVVHLVPDAFLTSKKGFKKRKENLANFLKAAEGTAEAANYFEEAAKAATADGVNDNAKKANICANNVLKSMDPSDAAMSSMCNIIGFVLLLVLVSLAGVVELQAYNQSRDDKSDKADKVWTVFLFFRCSFAVLGLVALWMLQFIAFWPRKVNKARIGNILIKDFPSSIEATHELCSQPSSLFVFTFIVFAIPNMLSMWIEITCIGISRTEKKEPPYWALIISWRVLLFAFTISQTILGCKFINQSVQLRLGISWILLSIVMATNISVWFSTIGLEVQGINGGETVIPDGSYCAHDTIHRFNHLLYPFQIEYCVMASLMAYTLMSSMGRLAEFLKKKAEKSRYSNVVQESARDLLHTQDSETGDRKLSSEFKTARKYPFILGVELLLLILSLAGVGFVGFDAPNNAVRGIIFESILLTLHGSGLLALFILLLYVRSDSKKEINTAHFADRLLLWLGAATILLNSLYRIWDVSKLLLNGTVPNATDTSVLEYLMMDPQEEKETHNDEIRWKLQIANGGFNMVESAAQVALLEWVLISGFSNTSWLYERWHNKNKKTPGTRPGTSDQEVQIRESRPGTSDQEVQTRENRPGTPDREGQATEKCINHKIRALLNLLMVCNAGEWILSALCYTFFFPKNQKHAVSLLLMPLQVFYSFHSVACIHDFKKHLKMRSAQSANQLDPAVALVIDYNYISPESSTA